MMTMRKFPMDGYADTCIGVSGELHGTNDELGTGVAALCSWCRAIEDRIISENQSNVVKASRTSPRCTGGCSGHAHGSHYYDCLCCYGD